MKLIAKWELHGTRDLVLMVQPYLLNYLLAYLLTYSMVQSPS